jgi:hypothetical protein
MSNKKLAVKTWQISLFVAIVVFVVFLVFTSRPVGEFMAGQIPEVHHRTFVVGLLLATFTFLACGVHHHYLCPVKEKCKKEKYRPMGILDR